MKGSKKIPKQFKPERVGKFSRKKRKTCFTEPIGVFITEPLVPMLTHYCLHLWHVMLLGKNYLIGERRRNFRLIEGARLTQKDFAEQFKTNFNGAIMTEHFGDQLLVSLEGCYEWCKKIGEDDTVAHNWH